MADDLDALDAELAAAGLVADSDDLDDPMVDIDLEDLGDDDLDDELDDDVVEILADDEDDPDAVTASLEEVAEEEAEADDEDGDDEDAVLASTILQDEFDDELTVLATPDEDDEDDDEVREGEFVCRSCFMAKRETALADPDAMLCLDCV